MTQPGTAGTDDDPLDSIETDQLVVNGEVIDNLVGLAFDTANASDGVLRFDGTGSTNGITDGSAKVIVGGTVYDVAGGEWVDAQGTSHSLDSWEKVVNSQFDVTITGVSPDPVKPGNTLDVTADITNNGTDSDTQTVTLDIDNSVGQVDSASVTLSGGGSVTKTLSWAVPSTQTEQDYTATVASDDDPASQTVTVGAGIPASAVHRHKYDEGSGSVAGDSVGSVDLDLTGVGWVSDPNYQGGAVSDYDGSDDEGQSQSNLTDVGDTGTLCFTVNFDALTSSGEQMIAQIAGSSGRVYWRQDGNNSSPDRYRVGLPGAAPTHGFNFSTGTKYRVQIVWDNGNYDVYINNPSNADASGTYPNTVDTDGRLYNGYRGTANDNHADCQIDDVIVYDGALSASERQTDYDEQPWT
jgi:hypothetical protein